MYKSQTRFYIIYTKNSSDWKQIPFLYLVSVNRKSNTILCRKIKAGSGSRKSNTTSLSMWEVAHRIHSFSEDQTPVLMLLRLIIDSPSSPIPFPTPRCHVHIPLSSKHFSDSSVNYLTRSHAYKCCLYPQDLHFTA